MAFSVISSKTHDNIMRELEFVKYLTCKFRAKKPVVKGIGDDAAVLEYTKNKYMLVTCDMIIEGTHFTKKTHPREIGYKAMAVNISDIAAMGGIPRHALISAGVAKSRNAQFLKEIMCGIEALAKKFNINIIGGDTNRSPKTVINITLMGEIEKKNLVLRSGARAGDLIFVTGALGEGKSKHLNFIPRVKTARTLVKNFKITSMMDISDGLAMDINRLAEASKKGACVYESLIPLSKESLPIKKAITSGEDFELLFTASLKESKKIIKRMGKTGDLPITLIGEIMPRRFGIKIVEENGKQTALKPRGFEQL